MASLPLPNYRNTISAPARVAPWTQSKALAIIGDQENKDFRDFMNSLEKDFREKYPGVLGEETQGLGQ
jgi:hypothetical protein